MKKKVLSLLTIVCMTVALLSANIITAFAYTGTQYDDYLYYTISNGEATITDCNSYATSIVIPININGYPVTSIGNNAFYYCTRLTSVTIPDSVTSIGFNAFDSCKSLTSITIPNSVTSIGNSAFNRCTSLKSVTIPDSVTSIGDLAFGNCTSLTSVTIPDSVTSIGDSAFKYCASLTSVTIPNSVTSIGDLAFGNCTSLTSINVEESNENYCSVDGILFNKDKTSIIKFPQGKEEKKYVIPNSVTSIGDEAFRNCTSLTSITIPDSVTSIGDSAFSYTGYYNNDSNWENDVLYIGNYLIEAKEAITSCEIKPGTKLIADDAFHGCTSLTSITIPDSVTSIGESAFYWCKSLESIIIPNSVTNIGCDAFSWCDVLERITIPDSVTSIGEYAFYGCTGLKKVNIPSIEAWCNISFRNYSSNPLHYAHKLYLNDELVTNLIIPDSVTSIGNSAFYNCESLTSVTIPDSVTSIGERAFRWCSSLTKIVIPKSVTSIETSFDSDTLLCVYENSYAYNFAVENNLKYTLISDIYIENGITYSIFEEKATVILVDSDVEEAKILSSVNNCPVTKINDAFKNHTNLKNLVIPDSVTSIKSYEFYGCESLTSITIPDSVTSIGDSAFSCTGYYNNDSNWENNVLYIRNYLIEAKEAITSCEIKPGTKLIADDAFYGCKSLTSITIPDSVTSIGEYAFNNCDSLTSITIPDSVTSIGEYAFNGCISLTSITIPDSITSIGDSAFKNCISLTSITIPDNISYIGAEAFLNCRSLTSVTIPNGVTSIGKMAFNACRNLVSVAIPNSVKNIGGSTFEFSWNLSVVFYEGNSEDWNKIKIGSYNDVLNNATIIYNVTKKTYKFETNCENKLSDITDYAVMTAPEIKNGSKTFLGWYDNKSFTGNPVSFPYYGEATTLYALWGGTDTVCISAGGDKIFISTLSNIPENASVILACYKGEMLVDVQTEPNKNSSLYFIVKEDFDSAKVMVWDSLSSMNSDYKVEDVILN